MTKSVLNENGVQIKFDPKKIKYNSHGIPVFSALEIEMIAEELLQNHCPHVFQKPSMTPVLDIISHLIERTGLRFVWQDLGYKGTAKVLGKVSFDKKTLYLDCSLDRNRKSAFRFTAAHEIGHWVLHRYNYKNWNFGPNNTLQDDESSLCRLEQRTQNDWLEFHANVFAAALIMPREMFITALMQIQQSIGINKNVGHIYLSNSPSSYCDYETTVNQLAQTFLVSKKSVRVRLKTLRLITSNSKHENETYAINPFTILQSLQNKTF